MNSDPAIWLSSQKYVFLKLMHDHVLRTQRVTINSVVTVVGNCTITYYVFTFIYSVNGCMLLLVLFIQLSETSGSSLGYGYNRVMSKPKSQPPDSLDETQVPEGATWRLPHIYIYIYNTKQTAKESRELEKNIIVKNCIARSDVQLLYTSCI